MLKVVTLPRPESVGKHSAFVCYGAMLIGLPSVYVDYMAACYCFLPEVAIFHKHELGVVNYA